MSGERDEGATLGDVLLKEIERVSTLKGHYEAIRGLPRANPEPAIFMMSRALALARKAISDDNAVACLRALEGLRSFTK